MTESIVASAVQWIGSLLIQEANTLFDVADQVRGLQQELELMQQYLQDADAKHEDDNNIRQITKLAYDAEDVIDIYVLNVQARSEESYESCILRLACFMHSAPKMYEVGKQIHQTRDKVKQIIENLNNDGFRRIPAVEDFRLPRHRRPQRRSYYYDDNFEYVVGLEKDMQKLLLEVLTGERNTQIKLLSIMGMGGCGKTTVARKLYNHPCIKKCFMNCMAWVSISQEWDTRHVLSEILRKVGGPKETSELHAKLNVEELMDKLYNILKEKLYLVILDDVWRKEALEQILPALPWGPTNHGSKIIITTRNRKIILSQNLQQHVYVHKPRPLSEEEGWDLLSKLALSHRRNCKIESFERLGKEMLKKCGGLPLAIVALAGILNTRESIGEWQLVSDTVRSRVMEGTYTDISSSVQDLLALSYEDLPYDLKPCFLYLGVFPEDCQISAGMLTRMWIAEGLVVAPNQEMSEEDVAVQCLEELSHRFMIQVVKTNFKGAIKAFHLHDLLRDLCLKKAKEKSFLHVYTGTSDQATSEASMLNIQPRRAALHSSITFPTQVSNLRSLVLLTKSSSLHNTYVSKTLDLRIVHQNFKLLRLLNLWGIKAVSGTLPTEIGSFIHLRYLGLRASNIIELPNSIGNLRKLLTLDYRNIDSDSNIPIRIPNIFGKFVQLRHLYLPVQSPWRLKELQLSSMSNLQILWGVRCVGGGDWFAREVPKLSTNLKKLKVIVTTEKDLKAVFNCPSLTVGRLHTFHCEWSNGVGLQLANPIFPHNQHLHKLVLVGKLQVNRLSFILPPNLVVLELKDSTLENEDPMMAAGALAHLKLLKLTNSFLGTTFTCKDDSFPVLEELYLASLPKLNMWEVQTGALPCLKKLVIIKCGMLHMFPLGLPFVSTLQQLECFGVPQEFVQKAEEAGWSRQSLRLPHNFEAIIEQSDTSVDFSSISKLYEQLTAGVFLNNKTQKYWVVKRNESYYNCFMLYANCLSLAECHPFKDIYLDNCWEWSEIEESEGVLIKVGKLKSPPFSNKFFNVLGDFDAGNLSPEITYEIAFVIKLPFLASERCLNGARSYFVYAPGTSNAEDSILHDKPKDEWTRVTVGEFRTSPEKIDQTLAFRLSGIEPGFEIRCVVIEPKALNS
ncbi:disease resistance protein RPP8 [Spinacia oleracea]|uniref:Disease resistance protein RPP8 n=1 Tax=Spinacia oleracea TaxID=3562 RepID=A0ABM3RFZ8_SPIOL|nr:disease resistance protein RPP8-like [Spinacia oleracea]XP_056694533.1 disease resistance protein RPP8-like [Spinacia oleracea]XP_056694534.1 disease resistance protein RPP8-like [Spinacia oleracea]